MAFGVITLIMIILLRNLRLGLIAMVPNLMPILMIAGIMGFLDIGDIRQGSTGIGPRVGYGVGVNLDSRGGLIQLQYGLSPGTALVDGKVHIRLGTAF